MNRSAVDLWFVEEVLPLEAALTGYLRRKWREASEIPDLRQEIYTRVYEAATVAIPEMTKPFLFMTARNLLIDRARRAQVVSIETVIDLEDLDVADTVPNPEQNAGGREILRLLQAAINRLPPRCREVTLLRKVHGLPQRDVARRMGISESTVEQQVAKGVRLIADAMVDIVPEPVTGRFGRRLRKMGPRKVGQP
ncbi:RNA polymerase sigma factor [Nitrospirillum sp. BR 11163]|uniref:RNA polymerase sigma factor n=1 Tax=Nitrospirillum sp. BR 11163 TaxID=3104323 RepID=UPI002AFE7D0D|nr:RNA polymerase sigma factor [Nitrospirillum sp. BR 11163]MEA1673099.1 RNA polymerase sigma factor [Nitrospirillum sp. BR 11163]